LLELTVTFTGHTCLEQLKLLTVTAGNLTQGT